MMRNPTILACLLIILSGCSIYHVDSENITSEYYPAKNSPAEVVFIENVEQPHDVIGYITVNTERNQKMNAVLEKMKREAALLGADAITHIQTDSTGVWKRLPAQKFIGNAYVRANFKATAVKFK